MKQYRFKFITKEGVLLGYFLSIGSKLVSQQEAKVFSADENILNTLKENTLDKITFQGLNIDDVIIKEEQL